MSQGFTKDYPQPVAGDIDLFVNGTKTASTSGTAIDFTLPSGIKMFRVTLVNVSTSGTAVPRIQLGDSTGVYTTGYQGGMSDLNTSTLISSNATTALALNANTAGSASMQGIATFVLHDASTNHWVGQWIGGRDDSVEQVVSVTERALTNELTTVRITMDGVDTFDAGSINVQYDNPSPTVAETVYLEGNVVQVVKTTDGTVATGTTTIPFDNTVPQSTEGIEFMTLSITPTNASNLLRIDMVLNLASSNAAGHLTACLFQDSTASALAVGRQGRDLSNNAHSHIAFTHWMTAGTTSSTTFKVRAGNNTAGTTTFNGQGGTQTYGGALASSITITEYKP